MSEPMNEMTVMGHKVTVERLKTGEVITVEIEGLGRSNLIYPITDYMLIKYCEELIGDPAFFRSKRK